MTHEKNSRVRLSQTSKPFVVSTMTLLFCLGSAPFVTGCGSTAIITKRDGVNIEGKISRHDTRKIYIEAPAGGSEVAVSRQDVADIDHPGNVAGTIGGILTGYGVANIIVGASQCDTQGAAYCTGVFLPATLGVSLLIYGVSTWASSVDAAGNADKSMARQVTVVPIASMDKTNQFYGASAKVSF